jgi:paraquat-inducible protein B
MSEHQQPPEAKYKKSWWPGWIWAVPIAALAIVAWLGLRYFANQGPSVTVTFETAGGVKASDTKVKYKDMVVGEVEEVQLKPDLQHVDVTLRLNSTMSGHLGPDTRFWIEGENLSLSNLSAIKTLVSGPYIGIDPRPGKQTDHFQGLTQPPVLKAEPPGTRFTLHADRLSSVSRGSPIYYLDLKVGEVQGFQLGKDMHSFEVYAFIQSPFDKLVHASSRFWNASAVRLSTQGTGPSLHVQSLPALFEGAIAFETPQDVSSGKQAAGNANFTLYDSKDAAENAPHPADVPYRVTFTGQSDGLAAGAPVMLEGNRVGTVRDSALQYRPGAGTLDTRATIALDPKLIQPTIDASGDSRGPMDAMMRNLIEHGLRAELGRTTPLIGGTMVSLRFVPHAKSATLGDGTVPEIPTGSGADIDAIIAKAGDVMDKIDQLPLSEIADDIHQTTQKLAALSQSPELTESLRNLDRSVTNIEHVTAQARTDIGPILTEIRRAAREAQQTLASAQNVMGGGTQAIEAPGSAGLPSTLYELKRAARSLRELSDYLDRHPEALLRGKGNGE